MLDRDRWWNSKRALINQRVYGIYNPDNLQILLDEQYRTQVALESLHINVSSKPSEIPMINVLAMPQGIIDLRYPTTLSLIGMPRSGKSSSLKYFGDEEWAKTFGERAGEVKDVLDRTGQFSFETQTLWQRYLQYEDYLSIIDKNEVNQDYWVTFDRDWTDVAMTRANILFGRLDPAIGISKSSLQSAKEDLDKYKKGHTLVILLLTRPEESLKREGPRKSPGRIMNLPFLQVLYEQYLRFHYEMLFYTKTYGKNRPFFYACLDGSGDPYATYRMIEKTMFWYAMATTGGKRPPQFIEIY